jgi:dihydroflavonol-4-reductase
VDRGEEVVALVRDVARAREALPQGVELVHGDVTELRSVREAVSGVEGVFNCMGIYEQWTPDSSVFERVNVIGALNVIAAARQAGARRAVHTSTFDVFHAERGGTVHEDNVADYPKPTPYERSKQRAEDLVLGEAQHGIEVVIANPASVYGPGPWQAAGVDGFMRDAARGRLPVLPPGGLTLAYVDDVAEGHLAAFDRGVASERYILADGFATNREVCETVVDAAGSGRVPPTMPGALARSVAVASEGVSRLIRRPPLIGSGQLTFLQWQARADSTKAREQLGIEFRPWSEGIPLTVRWMKDEGRV